MLLEWLMRTNKIVDKKEHRPVSLRSEVYEQFREFQSKIRYEELRGANLSLSDTLVFLMNAYEELTTTKEGGTELAAIQKDIAEMKIMLEIAPNRHEFIPEIARLYHRILDDKESALIYYNKYLSLYPEDVQTNYLLGIHA